MRIFPVVAVFLVSCTPELNLIGKLCSEDGTCPAGLRCHEGRCVEPETILSDSGTSAVSQAVVDAGVGADAEAVGADAHALVGMDAGVDPVSDGPLPGCVEGAGEPCTLPARCGATIDCEGVCQGGVAEPACSCGPAACEADGRWSLCPGDPNVGEACSSPSECGATIQCDGSCGGGAPVPNCACGSPICHSSGEWVCADPANLGTPCATATGCGGMIACDGACVGAVECNNPPGQCSQWSNTCDAVTGACVYAPRTLSACDDGNPCTYDDTCDANGSCGGTAVTCSSDACVNRSCNGTPTCTEQRLGTAVHEIDASGWDYNTSGSGTLVFRTPVQNRTLYLLASPAIPDKMLSQDPNESNTCDWCACSINCAFSNTGRTVVVSSSQQPGMVPLYRWVNPSPSIRHRAALTDPGNNWNPDGTLGYVCSP